MPADIESEAILFLEKCISQIKNGEMLSLSIEPPRKELLWEDLNGPFYGIASNKWTLTFEIKGKT